MFLSGKFFSTFGFPVQNRLFIVNSSCAFGEKELHLHFVIDESQECAWISHIISCDTARKDIPKNWNLHGITLEWNTSVSIYTDSLTFFLFSDWTVFTHTTKTLYWFEGQDMTIVNSCECEHKKCLDVYMKTCLAVRRMREITKLTGWFVRSR